MDKVLAVVLDTLGILAIICFGAFIVVLVADLILSAFDKHQGIFFNRKKKNKNVAPVHAQPQAPTQATVTPYINNKNSVVTVTPYIEEKRTLIVEKIENEVDFDKAAAEQRLIQGKKTSTQEVEIHAPIIQKEDLNNDDYFAKVSDVKSDINVAIKEVTEQALKELETDKENFKSNEKEAIDKAIAENAVILAAAENARLEAEAKFAAEQESIRLAENARLAEEARFAEEQEALRLAEQEALRLAEEARFAEEERARELEELKQIKEDILRLRNSVMMDVHRENDAMGIISNPEESEIQDEILEEVVTNDANSISVENTELTDDIREKLRELEELKLLKNEFNSEKVALMRFRDEAMEKSSELEQEKVAMALEIEQLKKNKSSKVKPYYSLEYYENKLENLLLEIKDAEKELKSNKREFIPLQRIKKSYERNNAKLRRKEAIVARQKIALYGVSNSGNIDQEKKDKLEDEVKLLNELKDSVFHCDQVLKQNKDRYPVLEKSNKILTKQYNRVLQDVESVNSAISWYKSQKLLNETEN